ncbi:hypothetical protein N7456_001314 [Penicillium angulare]|uniref:Zn(2)-C6 fungal-type domain-containing protein n=1 Tax=Penicillium angulare TaxID=116970 RepID=A0A9W9GDS9_9EURO|nr:hypothetical protein N7456_001314 [Penicillium angulare]
MPGVPSNKACERCKKKHLKCDETRPHCQRCTTAGVDCPGYVQTRKFIDQGATVRRRYAPYQDPHSKTGHVSNSESPEITGQPAPFQYQSGAEGEPAQTQVYQGNDAINTSNGIQPPTKFQNPEVPEKLVMITSPSQLPARLPPNPETNLMMRNGESHISSGTNDPNPISPNVPLGFTSPNYPRPYTTTPSSQSNHHGLTPSEIQSQQSEKEEFHDIFSDLMTDTEHEAAFLTRHYAEVIAPWLDLSDSEKFFSVYVPIRAISCTSLKYAVASLAAKQLGRVKGAKSSATGGMFTNPAGTETYPNAADTDWFLKAANYYYMAVSDLNNTTSGGYDAVSSSAVLESPIEMLSQWFNSPSTQELFQNSQDNSFLRKVEDTLATVTLLTTYRLIDLKGNEWHKHLSGTRSLFAALLNLNQIQSSLFSHGVRASFWNFARQDYLGSYFTRSPTHFSPTDLSLWRAAGLSMDGQGKFQISSTGPVNLNQEDQASNGLTWLLSKVINFLAESKQSQIAQWTGYSPESADRMQVSSTDLSTNTWLDLSFDLQTWFEGVPETFRPCIRIESPRDFSKLPDSGQLPFPEVVYSHPTCAATMQHYHFGRIALLLNRPPDIVSAPSTAFDRLQGYREVTKEVEYRSQELCGIALGRPQGAIRVHMIPLLFAVGQCVERPEEHRIIVDLLRGVEADLGWATDYVVRDLEATWNR